MNYGLALMANGDTKTALDYFERAAVFIPNYSILEINRGIAKGLLGRDAEAEAHFLRAIQLSPDQSTGYFYYGRWLLDKNRREQAVFHLARAIQLNPNDFQARALLSQVHASMQQWKELGDLVEETLRLAPSDISGRHYEKVLQSARGKSAQLAAAAAKSPTPESYLELSLAHFRAGRYMDCVRSAEQALELRPGYAEAYNNIAACLQQRQHHQGALSQPIAPSQPPPREFRRHQIGARLHQALCQGIGFDRQLPARVVVFSRDFVTRLPVPRKTAEQVGCLFAPIRFTHPFRRFYPTGARENRTINRLMSITRRAAAAAFAGACVASAAPKSKRPPNIVYILADDLGWGELGCYGNIFNKTPNLDRLAKEGIRFTHAYSAAPVCSPTRASLMTGHAPARVGITDFLRADDRKFLPPDRPTLPRILQQAGYRTALIGKWHLMGDYKRRPGDPKLHGFDEVICSEQVYIGPGSYWHPYQHLPGIPARSPEEYLTDRLSLEASDFIERNAAKPFFLYLSHYAPHTRFAAKPELVAKYKSNEEAGTNRNNPELAAMIESIDEGIGRILETIRKANLDNDTLVVFNSDNGGEGRVTVNGHLRGAKSMLYEGGIRVPLLARWKGRIKPAATSKAPVISTDLFPTFLQAAGAKPPSQYPLDGSSLMKIFSDPQRERKRRLYWHYPHNHSLGGKMASAVRDERWKLIEFIPNGRRELYDLQGDPSEVRDIASEHPDIARSLAAHLQAWRVKVLPALSD
jgi:arylsulfatase A-like enzyme/Flp pilus assembly protein TadD